MQKKVVSNLVFPSLFSSPPDVVKWFAAQLQFPESQPFPLPHDFLLHFGLPLSIGQLKSTSTVCSRTRRLSILFCELAKAKSPVELVALMCQRKFSLQDLEDLPFGLAVSLRQVLFACRENPPTDWMPEAYSLIGKAKSYSQFPTLPRFTPLFFLFLLDIQRERRLGQPTTSRNHEGQGNFLSFACSFPLSPFHPFFFPMSRHRRPPPGVSCPKISVGLRSAIMRSRTSCLAQIFESKRSRSSSVPPVR